MSLMTRFEDGALRTGFVFKEVSCSSFDFKDQGAFVHHHFGEHSCTKRWMKYSSWFQSTNFPSPVTIGDCAKDGGKEF